jgi:hypothetical protein
MEFEKQLESIQDFVNQIKKGTVFSLHVPNEQLVWQEDTCSHLPVFIFDRDNKPVEATDNPFIMP